MEIFLCFCTVLFTLTFLAVMIKNYRQQKKQGTFPADLSADLLINKSKNSTLINKSKNSTNSITSCRATKGSVVNCSSKGVKIRLSRGGYFSGKVNGKLIELEGPKDKDWEEFDIKT